MSCPPQLGLPLSRLNVPDIQAEVVSRGLVASISGTTIWQWLSEDAIRPWRHRSWIFPRDLDFAVKAGRVLDLYARKFGGQRLKTGSDLKGSTQHSGSVSHHLLERAGITNSSAAPGR